jgi:hypothetical protein
VRPGADAGVAGAAATMSDRWKCRKDAAGVVRKPVE